MYDPTASLSAERRGTLSLPDPDSAYGGSLARYHKKARRLLLLPGPVLSRSFLTVLMLRATGCQALESVWLWSAARGTFWTRTLHMSMHNRQRTFD